MNKLLRFITLLCVLSLMVGIPVNRALADGPTPVGTPATGDGNISIAAVMYPQGFPSKSLKPLNAMVDVCCAVPSSVWTTDGNGNAKTVFNPGDSIRYYYTIYNSMSQTVSAYLVVSRSGPCGSATVWSGNTDAERGAQTAYQDGIIPGGCSGTTNVYTVSVLYNGMTFSKSVYFYIGGVKISSIWTTDENGKVKTVFNPGEKIRYYYTTSNSTGQTALHVPFALTQRGSCGILTISSKYLDVSAGTHSGYQSGTISQSGCSGAQRYTVTVRYNGTPSSRSDNLSINTGVVVSRVWTTDGNGNVKTIFNPGDVIFFNFTTFNSTGQTAVNVLFTSRGTGACSWQSPNDYINLQPGAHPWSQHATIPLSGCSGTQTYTAFVSYNGIPSWKSVSVTFK